MKIQNISFILSLFALTACGEVEEATVKEVEIDMKDEQGSEDEFEEGVSWDAFEEELEDLQDECQDGNQDACDELEETVQEVLEESEWSEEKDDYIDEVLDECIDGDEEACEEVTEILESIYEDFDKIKQFEFALNRQSLMIQCCSLHVCCMYVYSVNIQ